MKVSVPCDQTTTPLPTTSTTTTTTTTTPTTPPPSKDRIMGNTTIKQLQHFNEHSLGTVTTEEPSSTQETTDKTTTFGSTTQKLEDGFPWHIVLAIVGGVLVVLIALSIVGYIYRDEIQDLFSSNETGSASDSETSGENQLPDQSCQNGFELQNDRFVIIAHYEL